MSRPTSGAYPRSRLSLSAQGKNGLHVEELVFVDTLTHELPGDPLTAPTTDATRRPASAPAEKKELKPVVGTTATTANSTSVAALAPARTPRAVRGAFYSLVPPDTGCVHPLLIAASPSALSMLGLARDEYRRREFCLYMSGATQIPRARPWSAAYGGHQYGCYSGQLGDGRCVTLGEIIIATAATPSAHYSSKQPPPTRYEIQLKGAGLTPYSRFGDGLATLAAAVREFIAAEFMHSMGILTTRALAVVATQVHVYRGADPQPHAGAVLSRASSCWVRFGTFELFHYRHDKERVKMLADYVIKYHFQDVLQAEEEQEQEGEGSGGASSGEGDATNLPLATPAESREGLAGVNRQAEQGSDASPLPDASADLPKSDSEEKTDSDKDNDNEDEAEEEDEDEDDVLDELVDKPPPQSIDRRGTRRLSFVFQSFPTPSADAMQAMEAAAAQAPTEATRAETVVVDVELNAYARFFQEVIRRTADLVASWQAIGFVHGEMNTVSALQSHPQQFDAKLIVEIFDKKDNMSILGVTMDYGSYGFLDGYDPYWTPNPADRTGRYRFERQAKIALWNLSKLGRTLAELIAPPPPPAAATGNQPTRSLVAAHVVRGEEIVRELLKGFEDAFVESYAKLMCKKLGLQTVLPTDLPEIIDPLLQLLADAGADYTNFFSSLCIFDNPTATDVKDAPTSLDILLRGVARLYVADDNAGDEDEPEHGGTLAASMSGALGVTDREITKSGESNGESPGQDESDRDDTDTHSEDDKALNNEALRKDSQRSNRSSTSSLRARFVIPDDDGTGSSDSVSQMSEEITERWAEWCKGYRARLALEPPDAASQRLTAMRKANPRCIPRQHKLNDLTRQVLSRVPATGQAMRRSGMQGMDPDMERVLRVVIQGGGDGGEEDVQCLREWCEEPPDIPFRPDKIPL
ncbi:hypothetical protein HDU87_007888 [Geranomyces variabilis]|uniref:Selenoprotein O n=1 Tax=Geranomyces variabilis TaxID=109894 RepID=A0AAD5TDI1_9FUNG|nr:hypothetical protein HDU87_007888 [Geranomyces variabilis]